MLFNIVIRHHFHFEVNNTIYDFFLLFKSISTINYRDNMKNESKDWEISVNEQRDLTA